MIIVGLLLGTGIGKTTHAQANIQVNLGNQPIWGPTGYDHVDYYYLPDLDIYYYVPLQQWVYFNGRRWITTTILPPQYSNYDLYRLHKVGIKKSNLIYAVQPTALNMRRLKGATISSPFGIAAISATLLLRITLSTTRLLRVAEGHSPINLLVHRTALADRQTVPIDQKGALVVCNGVMAIRSRANGATTTVHKVIGGTNNINSRTAPENTRVWPDYIWFL